MKIEPASVRNFESIDALLAAWRGRLIADLDARLDVKAGLSEVMIYARRDCLVSELRAKLDVEAGLASILNPATVPTVPRPPLASPERPDSLRFQQAGIPPFTPERRLTLRQHPALVAALCSSYILDAVRLTAAVHDFAVEERRKCTLDIRSTTRIARDLAKEVSRMRSFMLRQVEILAQAHDIAEDLAVGKSSDDATMTSLQRDHAAGLVDALRFADDATEILAEHLAEQYIVGHRVTVRRRAFDMLLSLVDVANRALEAAIVERGSLYAFSASRLMAPATSRDIVGSDNTRAFLVRLFSEGDEFRAQRMHELDVVVTEFCGLVIDELPLSVLDDFTRADLSQTRLTHANLIGVEWSLDGTRWPPGFDVEALKRMSREVERGSGIFVVDSTPDGVAVYGNLADLTS